MEPHQEFVHFAFRPSVKDILDLMKIAPNLRVVQLPESYNSTLSRSVVDLFEMRDIELIEGDVWGHRSDIDEYFRVPVDRIMELSGDKKSVKNIAALTRVNEALIKYVLENE